ncbi:MAG TPA: phenylacetic acid degradation protein [Trueperaceae bacterium]|nr:phenylacetic acid degradation protein [Trueperaceae bacterium]
MRWEVFKQDAAGKPHQAVGSVHAVEAEGALLNARHVFARRPAAVSLWVTPADAIHSWTAEQVAAAGPGADDAATKTTRDSTGTTRGSAANAKDKGPGSEPSAYLVFCKTTNRRSMTFVDHVGEVMAVSPAAALAQARAHYGEQPVLAWWLVPKAAVVASAPQDAEAWFEPARDKTYKQQSAYGSVKPGGRASGSPR